tara:strand:- start:148 stop:456 length:309 start_codon:yes stop_codon:yes gene_type:complete
MIEHNDSLTAFSYIDKKGNMIDITHKCPIELCKTMKTILGDNMIDESLKEKKVEDIYHFLIEKTYQMPEWVDMSVMLNDKPKDKLKIAFNKFFFDMINYENI